MIKSSAERGREFRARRKAALNVVPDQSAPFLKRTFAQFLEQQGEDRGEGPHRDQIDAELMGVDMQLPDFTGEDEIDPISGEGFRGPNGSTGSIAKAEVMAHAFRVSAQQLAALINRYKMEEIDARLAEIERADLTDPEAKRQALADVARLTLLRQRLDREVRHSFREIAVKGE